MAMMCWGRGDGHCAVTKTGPLPLHCARPGAKCRTPIENRPRLHTPRVVMCVQTGAIYMGTTMASATTRTRVVRRGGNDDGFWAMA